MKFMSGAQVLGFKICQLLIFLLKADFSKFFLIICKPYTCTPLAYVFLGQGNKTQNV